MKLTLVKILCISSALFVFGCDNAEEQQKSDPLKGDVSTTNMEEIGKSAEANSHYAVGRVTSVDSENRKIVVNLEPVPELNWPADSKSFRVSGKEDLNDLQTGDNVELYFIEVEPGNLVAHNLNER